MRSTCASSERLATGQSGFGVSANFTKVRSNRSYNNNKP